MAPGRGPAVAESEAAVRQVLIPLVVLVLAACTAKTLDKSADFDRHRYSRLLQPFDAPDRIYFDVRFVPDYPAGDATADRAREAWLDAWLVQRKLCADGHAVEKRRPFDYLEDNPAGYQERWEVRCTGAAGH
ncbi:MAG: hypothetical protein J0M16_03425 [Gammaproteobacteria bacterium]|nr:hypothetical protein [Gammaproteobacteria bacterium]